MGLYKNLTIVMWAALITIGLYACWPTRLPPLFGLEIKKWVFRSTDGQANQTGTHKRQHLNRSDGQTNDTSRSVDSTSQTILLTGDSMSECLLHGIRKYAKSSGHRLRFMPWYGSNLKWWAQSDTLDKAIKRHKPNLIILTLGGNELQIKNIWDREPFLQTILKKMDGTKYLYISTPNWRKDYGLTEMVAANVPEGQFYNSTTLKLARRKDGAHPTLAASYVWADSVASWIMNQSRYPILMTKRPNTHLKSRKKTKKPTEIITPRSKQG